MPIIDTDKKLKVTNFTFYLMLFPFFFFLFTFLTGCIQKEELSQAQHYSRQSQAYYRLAQERYKNLIAQGQDLDQLHFALGKLYYEHGDFPQAALELKKSQHPEAKKFLAISFYRTNNFTDALEIFNKFASLDAETLYYQGETCEKMNLFDQALAAYKKIKDKEFLRLASERINIIEKQAQVANIKELDPEIYKILSQAPSAEIYPQAGGLILYCDEKVEITEANTQVSKLHYLIKILNERGKESFSETQIEYDSTYEKVELEYARTIKPDGTVVEVGSRHIRDVSKYLNFPLYSNVRVYIISFPEIVEGASIEYKLKVYRNQLINKKEFVEAYSVQAAEPVIYANFVIECPKEKTVYFKTLNEGYNNFQAQLKPDIQTKDGRVIYTWKFKNIPQIIPEANMPPGVEVNPAILISSFSQWKDIYNWWWSLAKDKIKADAAIKDKVIQLTRGLTTEEAKARAIYNFCAQKIRYVAVEYGQAGYEPHSAASIFTNKYGDCKDQAILLVTMLKEAGLTAYPVLIPTKEAYNLNPDFPAVLFNHCIAGISLNNKIIFLDPTASTCPFGDLPASDQGREVLLFKEDNFAIQEIPLYPADSNLIRQYIQIGLKPDESISASRTVSSLGAYNQAQRYWLLYTQPELIEQTLKEKIQDISIGSKLDNYNIKNLNDLNMPVELTYQFWGPEYFTSAGNLRILPQLASLDASLVAKDKRSYPIDFDILDTKEAIFQIDMPRNFMIKYMPDNIKEDSPWLDFSVEYKKESGKIYFKQKAQLKRAVVLEDEYAAFKNFYEGLAKKIKQRIILEKRR
ncbi:MAG: hypothetical protein A2166_06625 [Omnitrophica WOR_2 bacterium RBG_13_41_10]|nr:MAG: hypothetical protein A2166_06625 [Omnitrophica WOR_2 bacterium RBG_13_41_10]